MLNSGNKELDDFYFERFVNTSHLFGAEIVYNYTGGTTFDVNEYISTLEKYDKVATLSTFQQTDLVNVLDKRYNKFSSKLDNYAIVYIPGGINFKDLLSTSQESYKAGTFFASGYVGNEADPNDYKTKYSLTNPDDYKNVVLIGILDELFSITKKYPATDIYTLISLMYSKPIKYLGGEMYLLVNHYISTPLYLISYNGASSVDIISTIQAGTFFLPSETYGSLETDSCNFLSDDDGKKTISYLPIAFILDMADYKMKLISIFVNEMINRMSSSLLGNQIKPIPIDSETGIESVINSILEYYNASNLHTLFVFVNPDIMMKLASILKPYDIQIFYIGETAGDYCEDNVIFGNFLTSSFSKLTCDYLQKENDFAQIIVVGTTTNYGVISINYLTDDLVSRGFDSKKIIHSDMVDNSEISANNVTKVIKESKIGNKIAVIVATESSYLLSIAQSFYTNGITETNGFHVIFYNLDEVYVSEGEATIDVYIFLLLIIYLCIVQWLLFSWSFK